MDVSIPIKQLRYATRTLRKYRERETREPNCLDVFIEARGDGEVWICGQSKDQRIFRRFDAEVREEGRCRVERSRLNSIAKRLNPRGGEVRITVSRTLNEAAREMSFEHPDLQWEMNSKTEYERWKTSLLPGEESLVATFTAGPFIEAIERAIETVAPEDYKEELAYLSFETAEDGEVYVVSTDRHRLTHWKVGLPEEVFGREFGDTVHYATLKPLPFLAGLGETEVDRIDIYEHEGLLWVGMGDWMIQSLHTCLDSWLDWQLMSPAGKNPETTVILSPGDLVDACDLVGSARLARDSSRVFLDESSDGGRVIVSAADESAKTPVEAEVVGAGLKTSFNPDYIKHASESMGTNRIRIESSGPISPHVWRPEGGEDNYIVVMPMKRKQ